MAPKTSPYEQSTDYQLPPGELWWICRYRDRDTEFVNEILFNNAPTWFQANKLAELLIREDLKLRDSKTPQFIVSLWGP